jgi:hypothetical protein
MKRRKLGGLILRLSQILTAYGGVLDNMTYSVGRWLCGSLSHLRLEITLLCSSLDIKNNYFSKISGNYTPLRELMIFLAWHGTLNHAMIEGETFQEPLCKRIHIRTLN